MRVKNSVATRRRRKRVLDRAEGYQGSESKIFKTAKQAVIRAGQSAYIDRRRKKREFRKLWITRVNAAVRSHDMSYSQFIHGLTLAKIDINRKMLSEIAINNPEQFNQIVAEVKKALSAKTK